MKISLSNLFFFVALVAVIFAWWIDHRHMADMAEQFNREAARITESTMTYGPLMPGDWPHGESNREYNFSNPTDRAAFWEYANSELIRLTELSSRGSFRVWQAIPRGQ